MPNGIPMIEQNHGIADSTWPIASHSPASTNHTMLPSVPSAPVPRSCRPVSSYRSIASRPNGKKQKLPITKHERAHGIPTSEISINRPAAHHPSPIQNPLNTNQ